MKKGILYIIAGPIGNPEDITYRAVSILKKDVSALFCEDTRQSGKLLKYHNISLPLRSLHTHSSEKRIAEACDILTKGNSIAYLTDSGTPSISDPGSKLVKTAINLGIEIKPVPGPSALTSIVSVSGFQAKRIIFGGFLGKKKNKQIKELEELKQIKGIIVVYESPYRIIKTLETIKEVFPESKVVIGREMTKKFEEFHYGTIEDIMNSNESVTEKGEFTIAILNE